MTSYIAEGTPITATDTLVGSANFMAEGALAGTALLTSYQIVATTPGNMKIMWLRNTCNQQIVVSLDGQGSVAAFVLEPSESQVLYLKEEGMTILSGTAIMVKHNGVTPTAGTIRISGAY